jgi:DNA repair protein RadC
LNYSSKAGEYCVSLLAGRTYEVFYALCMNSQNRLIYAALVQEGTLSEAPVYPRLVVEAALRHKAYSVILVHNHPGGSLQPSRADIELTGKVSKALEPISVAVIDHIIVAGDRYFSFKENGLL